MNITNNVDSEEVGNAAQLLKKYVKDASIEPLISALEALKQDPNNESLLAQFKNTFKELGIAQGAVLTYAPYVTILISDNPFGDD